MLLKDFIQELQQYDGELLVCIDGYEGGVTAEFNIIQAPITQNEITGWYVGEYIEVDKRHNTQKIETIPAIIIKR